MISNLSKKISDLSRKDVKLFRAYISGYVEMINESIWVCMACRVINGYVSDDTVLYFTLWLISKGENILLKTLYNPDSLSELIEIPFRHADFEEFLGFGYDEVEEDINEDEEEVNEMGINEKIIKRITKEIMPTILFKDGKKYGKYKSFEEGMKDIQNILPKLIKRAEMEEFDWKNYL